jgi:hypothetical protein
MDGNMLSCFAPLVWSDGSDDPLHTPAEGRRTSSISAAAPSERRQGVISNGANVNCGLQRLLEEEGAFRMMGITSQLLCLTAQQYIADGQDKICRQLALDWVMMVLLLVPVTVVAEPLLWYYWQGGQLFQDLRTATHQFWKSFGDDDLLD